MVHTCDRSSHVRRYCPKTCGVCKGKFKFKIYIKLNAKISNWRWCLLNMDIILFIKIYTPIILELRSQRATLKYFTTSRHLNVKSFVMRKSIALRLTMPLPDLLHRRRSIKKTCAFYKAAMHIKIPVKWRVTRT